MAFTQNTITSMTDQGISVAKLSIISLAKLRANDPAELSSLKDAASTAGFLHLDLRGDNTGERMLVDLPIMFSVAEKYFNQREEIKAQDVRLDISLSQDLGWKRSNGAESFEISRDEAAATGVAAISFFPQSIQGDWEKINNFNLDCSETSLTLLESLSCEFVAYHRSHQPSNTSLKFVSHPSSARLSDIQENLHTDSGTLTLLFYKDWSIHAFFRDADVWAFIPPLEGCVLVNVANALRRLSGGKLHSPEHRVTQTSDGAKDRYYISYLLRPETAVISKWNTTK